MIRFCIFALLGCLACTFVVSEAKAGGLDDARRGLIELAEGNLKESVFYNTRAIESGELEKESLAISYYNRATGYHRMNQLGRARSDFIKAYETWPEHPITRKKAREMGFLDE